MFRKNFLGEKMRKPIIVFIGGDWFDKKILGNFESVLTLYLLGHMSSHF